MLWIYDYLLFNTILKTILFFPLAIIALLGGYSSGKKKEI